MKKIYTSILMLASLLIGVVAMAQTNAPKTLITPEVWQQMKDARQSSDGVTTFDVNTAQTVIHPVVYDPAAHNHASNQSQTTNPCNCMQPIYPLTGIDSTGFMVVPDTYGSAPLYSNDDGSMAQLQLPFSFCFYGNHYTSCYINNNGNISFGSPYGTYSPVGLQGASEPMVAPFWSDVDTRPSTSWAVHPAGIVFYKVTPHALIVRWDSVGYYGVHYDKLADFQCIITDGTDPLVQGGNNVKFCYGIMQWTTGDASQGHNGFADTIANHGSPAAVGATAANNTDFIQFGLFGHQGSTFNGPNDNTFPYSGISWLQNQTFSFSTCSGNNVPPVVVGLQYCDTLRMCAGDTLQIPVQFQSPEANQITHDTAWYTGSGFSVIYDSTGNVSSMLVQIIGDSLNYGHNTLTFQATDNGSPVGITVITVDILVDSFNAPHPVINPMNPTTCANLLDSIWVVNPQNYTFFVWSNNAITDTIFGGPGYYSVTVTSPNGCRMSARDTIGVYPGSIPVINGQLTHCPGDSSTLSVNAGYVYYHWDNGDSTNVIHVDTGTFTVTVQDVNGCIGTSLPVTVIATSVIPTLTGTPHVCGNDTSHLIIAPSFNSYQWSNGMTTQTVWVHGGNFIVTVTDTAGCVNVDSFKVRQTANPIPVINGDTVFCGTDNVTLNVTPNGMTSYSWSNSFNSQSGVFSGGSYRVTVTDTSGCVGVDSIHIQQHPRPTPSIVGDSTFCSYDSTLLSVDSVYAQYLWNIGNTTQSITTNTANIYTVTVTNQYGCTGTSLPFNTTVYPAPHAHFKVVTDSVGRPDTIIHFYNISTVLAPWINESSWWSFGDGNTSTEFNTTHIFQTDGTYAIELITTTNKGCKDTAYDKYVIQSVPVIAPNVFTPNADGRNDDLVFQNLWQYSRSRVEIFNRWGNKLYDNADYKNDWQGDNNPDGVYYYILHVADLKGTIMYGWVEIRRDNK